jgi:ubiquinone biosynthesis protein
MKLMKPLQFVRLFHINIVLFRHRLDTLVWSTETFQTFSFLTYFNPWYWFGKKTRSRGESIRIALEELGPVFVKFGQTLSTRRDLLPEDIADELEKLQDQVPPFPGTLAKEILEKELKSPIENIFTDFDLVPLASASIAQVHAAALKNGKEVVVKIVRPNIEKVIFRDIGLLYSAATLAEKFLPHGKRLRPKEVVAELERSLLYELDLLHEGANASQLRRNFLGSSLLYIPEVFWEYSSHKVLVMERISGIPVSDTKALKEHGIDLKKLAEKGVEIFFTQVLRDSFFHADMHPGNIFVSKDNPQEPKFIAVDFGIMGNLSPLDQKYLAHNLLAFFRRDYRRVAELHIESGWVGDKIRIDEFETAIRGVCEPLFERPLKDISFGKLLLKLFQAAREFNMEVQPQFFLLQKTLLNIEGIGRQLFPELDLWSTAKPYIEKWVLEQISPRAILRRIYHHAPLWVDHFLEMPDMVHKVLTGHLPSIKMPTTKQSDLLDEKKYKKRKWLGVGFGFIIMALINYIFLSIGGQKLLLVNLIFGILGLLLIFISI